MTGRSFHFRITLSLLAAAWAAPAIAGSFYYDFAGGIGEFSQPSPFFGSTASSTSSGVAINNGVFASFGGSQNFSYQLGVQHRLLSAQDSVSGNYYGLQAIYPEARLQFWIFYIAGGYTPFVWLRNNPQSGIDYFSRAQSATGLLVEGGALWPITRKFSMSLNYGQQYISEGGASSPNPAWSATVSMRFYFGFFNSGSGGGSGSQGGSSAEYDGFRYPFGRIR